MGQPFWLCLNHLSSTTHRPARKERTKVKEGKRIMLVKPHFKRTNGRRRDTDEAQRLQLALRKKNTTTPSRIQ